MVKKGKKKHFSWFDLFNTLFMIVLAIIFLYPFWYTLIMSFATPQYATSLGIKIFPPEITLDAYRSVLSDDNIWVAYANTLFRTIVGTILSVLVTYCAGYALSRKNLPFRGAITFLIIFTMLFSGGLIPTFLTIKSYGLVNSRWALILPMLTSAWNIIIARNYISGLPEELEEAALVDGAHPLKIAFQIMWPLSMPVISVLALWSAVGHWNSWFDALIYCSGDDKIVLQLLLRRLLIQTQAEDSIMQSTIAATTSDTIKCATIIVAILPIICVYPFVQKYFVKGVTIGAVKG